MITVIGYLYLNDEANNIQTWTIKELDEISDIDFAIRILRERYNKLTNVYSPLSKKISRTIATLENKSKTVTMRVTAEEELLNLGFERCDECNNPVGSDWDYVDFTSRTVVKCTQCGELYHIENLKTED